jgi:hypothetical protein
MKNWLIAPSNEVARRLPMLGCPLDTSNVPDDGYDAIRRRLTLRQTDGFLENRIFDMDHGGTGFRISLAIGYGAAQKLTISDWELEVPGFNSPILWVEEPIRGLAGRNNYRIPGAFCEEYDREVVINHRRVLRSGDLVRGLLLGYTFESMPDPYSHGINLDVTLVLLDQVNRRFPFQICLLVNRKTPRSSRSVARPPRRRLFDSPDRRVSGIKRK